MKVRVREGGHLQVCLTRAGVKKYLSVRALVASTFLEEAPRADSLFYDTPAYKASGSKIDESVGEERRPAVFDFSLEPWTEKALCKGRPVNVHDTSNLPPSSTNAHRKAARKLCEGCPVLGDCADYAVRTKATGVVMAGVPIKSHSNIHMYEELRTIAGQRTQE
jgi:hypothetical protein